MKIAFNPSYDEGYYINLSENGKALLATKFIGTMGLLDHLSLHNGLSGIFASDGERASAYLSHVRKSIEGSMVEASFKNDALGVTKCLLQWRDALIMSGWDPSQNGCESTPKLQLLSKIESSWSAQLKGSADRWLELAKLSKKQPLLEEGDTIECSCSKNALPRLVQDVLVSCKASFTEYPEDIYIPDDANIEVLHYNDLSDAYRQVAANIDEYKNSVIINRDNVSLNHILFSWGHPLVGAMIQDSNPLTLQLFKLALSVFSRPLNIQNLLSYLQLPIGPVPARLRYALSNILIQEGGFGEIDWNELDEEKAAAIKEAGISNKWQLCIYDYINTDEDADGDARRPTKAERQGKIALLKYITDPEIVRGKNIPVEKLNEYIGAFNQWASAIAFNSNDNGDEMLKSQLATVVSYFRQLYDAISGMLDISYQDLEKLVRTIYQPTSIIQAHAQVGSLNVIGSYNQLVDSPEKILWLDCCAADQISDKYEFLSTAEKEWLNEQDNISIPRIEELLDMNRKEMICKLSTIKGKITLVTSDYHHNQKMAEHPIIAELKMQRGDSLKITEGDTSLPTSDSSDIKKIKQKMQYSLGKIEYAGRSESNTSIDTLINYPFDYTVQYIARLSKSSQKELGSIQKITGLVAHSFIERLVNSVSDLAKEDRANKMEELLGEEYDKRLEKAIVITGLSLMLKENEVDYNNFKFQLKKSIEVLLYIIKQKKLVPVGCEMKYEKPLGEVINDFNARIDMVLEDTNEKAVIFDFKWSYSKSYGEKIKDGKAIQLELYRRELIAQGKKVSAVGYYLFPKCVLETSDYETLKDADGKIIINHIDTPQDADIFKQIEKSITQRRKELQEGNIEEGEGMDVKDLPYFQKLIKGENMLWIGNVAKDKVTKKNPDPPIKSITKESNKVFTNKPVSRFQKTYDNFDSTQSPLEETPTTYPLLKGRLK